MSMNRTANPLRVRDIANMQRLGLHTRGTRPAILGDSSNNIYVAPNTNSSGSTFHYGKYWVRVLEHVDGDGFTTFSQAVPARNETFNLPTLAGFPILVAIDPTSGEWVIRGVHYQRLNAGGYNTNALNLGDPANRQIWIRNIRDGKVFVPGTAADSSETRITIEPFLFEFDGALYSGNKTLTDNVDLASNIPSAGNERLTLVAMRANDRTIQTVDSATRTISGAQYAVSDVATLVTQLDDYAMLLGVLRLADAQAVIREKALEVDLRQFINVPLPRGWPYRITRHTHLLANQQQTVWGSQTIEAGGVLRLDPDSQFRIEPEADLDPAYTRVTTTYSILVDNRTIGADASGGSFTITLPSAVSLAGHEYRVVKLSSAGTVTVATSSNQTINGSTTAILTTQWTAVVFVSTGTGWIIG